MFILLTVTCSSTVHRNSIVDFLLQKRATVSYPHSTFLNMILRLYLKNITGSCWGKIYFARKDKSRNAVRPFFLRRFPLFLRPKNFRRGSLFSNVQKCQGFRLQRILDNPKETVPTYGLFTGNSCNKEIYWTSLGKFPNPTIQCLDSYTKTKRQFF
jgi:hypothetical protein